MCIRYGVFSRERRLSQNADLTGARLLGRRRLLESCRLLDDLRYRHCSCKGVAPPGRKSGLTLIALGCHSVHKINRLCLEISIAYRDLNVVS